MKIKTTSKIPGTPTIPIGTEFEVKQINKNTDNSIRSIYVFYETRDFCLFPFEFEEIK